MVLDLDFVVVYTQEDKESMHVELALNKSNDGVKRAYCISNYRDPNELFAVADATKATAIHPGYGFFSENFRFARRCLARNRQITFIGPRWEVIRDLGSKINTKRLAKQLGIPVIPGTDMPIYSEIDAEGIAEELFYHQEQQGIKEPSILVKASAGGGGMGIEEVHDLATFKQVYRRIQNYAKRLFGDEGVLIEQCLRDYHHIEVQLLCSKHNEVVHFGTRNCTIQSTGRQKRVEIAPGFDHSICNYSFDAEKTLDKLVKHSVKLAKHVGYDSVGTWEWVVTRDGNPYLLEVNTRIQVENGISARIARIAGIDDYPSLLEEQLRSAFGDKLGYKQENVSFEGTSIELRIVAENTKRGFSPWCGTITRFELPARNEAWTTHTHVPSHRPYTIPTEYDPNLALAIIWGATTDEARQKAKEFIQHTKIEGQNAHGEPIVTNLDYLENRLQDILIF